MNIAIVEDEAITAMFLEESVEMCGHSCVGMFDDSNSILEFLKRSEAVDLFFIDVQIHGEVDGIECAAELIKTYPKCSIVFVTSFKDSQTIFRAKQIKPLGYLMKPISQIDIEAILMVVESAREHVKQEDASFIELAPYMYDKISKEISLNGAVIHLSKSERICLDCMVAKKNSYTYIEELISEIWGDENNRVASLRELMFRLRKKLPELEIKNVSGIGYMLS
ncbi:MAG: response regulator [Sulfurimonas sp.]|jgi:DNA-binding response OmpR family regulator